MGKCLRIITLRRYAQTWRAFNTPGMKPQPDMPFAEYFAAFKLEEIRRFAAGG